MFLVLGLDHSCPWLREGLSSKSRSLASDFFFESLALARKVVSSISPLIICIKWCSVVDQWPATTGTRTGANPRKGCYRAVYFSRLNTLEYICKVKCSCFWTFYKKRFDYTLANFGILCSKFVVSIYTVTVCIPDETKQVWNMLIAYYCCKLLVNAMFVVSMLSDTSAMQLSWALAQCRRLGEQGGRASLTTACAPHFSYSEYIFRTSRNDSAYRN